MQRWELPTIQTPEGSRSPVVLDSDENAARVVLIGLDPGQELGDHQVKEHSFVLVLDGTAHIEAGSETFDAGAGTLLSFAPDERRSISSAGGARILLFLAPWPGAGHYRGDEG